MNHHSVTLIPTYEKEMETAGVKLAVSSLLVSIKQANIPNRIIDNVFIYLSESFRSSFPLIDI